MGQGNARKLLPIPEQSYLTINQPHALILIQWIMQSLTPYIYS